MAVRKRVVYLYKQNGNKMKVGNEYLRTLNNYEKTPKAVYAAIAVSFANRFGLSLGEADNAIYEEWQALYEAGIIPQKPVK